MIFCIKLYSFILKSTLVMAMPLGLEDWYHQLETMYELCSCWLCHFCLWSYFKNFIGSCFLFPSPYKRRQSVDVVPVLDLIFWTDEYVLTMLFVILHSPCIPLHFSTIFALFCCPWQWLSGMMLAQSVVIHGVLLRLFTHSDCIILAIFSSLGGSIITTIVVLHQ